MLYRFRHLASYLILTTLFHTPNLAMSKSCADLFASKPQIPKMYFYDSLLDPSIKESDKPTVVFKMLTNDNDVVLVKEGEVWRSTFDYNNSFTPQADPRNPIFVFGIELAIKLGFQLGKALDGKIYLVAPGAIKFEKWIRETNALLIERGYEPIRYMLKKSDFADHEEVYNLITTNDPVIKLFLPYADNNPKLTVHEISFHLGAILFPKKFIERGHDINIRTKQLIEHIIANKSYLGDIADFIVWQLQTSRGFENDAGTANITGNLGALRERFKISTYSYISHLIKSHGEYESVKSLISAVDYYARPNMSPLAAVIKALHSMTGVDISELGIFPEKDVAFREPKLNSSQIYKKLLLSPREKNRLRKIIIEFVEKYKGEEAQKNYELNTPENWLDIIVSGLDERIAQILEVLK